MTSPELDALFNDPPRSFGPTPLWWWSGAAVTPDRLAWQMKRYDEGGIHNLVVINLAPAGPLFGAVTDDPTWFSETWWDRFLQTCEIASERDMKVWFYDQIGFSGANIQGQITNRHPEAAGRTLTSRVVRVVDGRITLEGNETLVGAYGTTDDARVESASDGRVDGVTDGTKLRVVTAVMTAFDYLEPSAVGLIMDLVHGEYDRRVPEHLGTVIPGSFQDEAPGSNAWTPRFGEEFKERRGYDILDHLPSLFAGSSTEARKVRGDYYAVRGALAEAAFFRPLGEWHSERGMILGADQFNPARAGFPTQSTQLYTDYMRTHRWYGAAGSDHEGDSKIHSSLAHLYDHERVWIESFHSSGWGGTLEDTYDWLLPFFRSGANLYNPHASYFGTAGGWFEWAPPSTDWRQPYWQQYPAFSRAVARIASMLSWGTYDADVAVLHPTATAQAGLTLDLPVDHFGNGVIGEDAYAEVDAAQTTYLDLVGTNNWFRTHLGFLDRARIAFDIIDDDSVVRESLEGTAIAVGGQRYRAVILPSATVLEEATAARMVELLDAGGRVAVVGERPRLAAGRRGDDAVVGALAAHPRLETYADAEAAAAAFGDLPGHAVSDVPILVRRNGAEGLAFVTGVFPNASGPRRTEETGWIWPDNTFDAHLYADDRWLRVAAPIAEAAVLNPATGERTAAEIEPDGAGSILRFSTGGAPAVLVAWTEGETPGSSTSPEAGPEESSAVDVPWTGSLVPTLDNTWGDLALPVGTDVDALQIWSLEWREDDRDEWTHAKATYGNRVRIAGPLPVTDVPEPLGTESVARIRSGEAVLADGWDEAVFSSSRGIEKPGHGTLGNKGLVPEEFIRVKTTKPGETAVVRTIVETEIRGEADLIVLAGAEKTVWWNGVQVAHTDANTATARVLVDRAVNVLEYRLGESRNAPAATVEGVGFLGSGFTLTEAGTFGERPEFMRVAEGLVPDGTVRFEASATLPADAEWARLVVGAAVGATVLVDDTVIARQAKVEYYESEWGANPAFFSHDVTALLSAGTHTVAIVADSVKASDVLFVDLVATAGADITSLVSGPGWKATTGGVDGTTIEHLGHWDDPASAHAALRAHPLPAVEWLRGAPIVGATVPGFRTSDVVQPRPQRYRFTAPSGTRELEVPSLIGARVRIGEHGVSFEGSRVMLDAPLTAPTTVEIETDATAFHRGGSAFAGPIRVTTAEAPIRLGDWRNIGLSSWSGGVRYSAEVEVPAATSTVLDLGDARGSMRVELDGEIVADLFCAPYRVDLGERRGTVRVVVTVNNTLAPFLDASTPTSWVFPSQMASGLYGPVTLRTR